MAKDRNRSSRKGGDDGEEDIARNQLAARINYPVKTLRYCRAAFAAPREEGGMRWKTQSSQRITQSSSGDNKGTIKINKRFGGYKERSRIAADTT